MLASKRLAEDNPICIAPKVKISVPTPQNVVTAPEAIHATPEIAGIQYGGQDTTSSGNADATVKPVTTNTPTSATKKALASMAPAFQQNTTVTNEETAQTKQTRGGK